MLFEWSPQDPRKQSALARLTRGDPAESLQSPESPRGKAVACGSVTFKDSRSPLCLPQPLGLPVPPPTSVLKTLEAQAGHLALASLILFPVPSDVPGHPARASTVHPGQQLCGGQGLDRHPHQSEPVQQETPHCLPPVRLPERPLAVLQGLLGHSPGLLPLHWVGLCLPSPRTLPADTGRGGVPQDQPRRRKSNPSQQEAKAEGIEYTYREREGQSLRETRKGKLQESPLCLGPGVFNGHCGLVHVSP